MVEIMTAVRGPSIENMPDNEKERIRTLMREAYIPAMSIASISEDKIQTCALGIADASESKSEVNPDTQFWACSLSKPVFAYLVIKLINDGNLPKDFLKQELPWDEARLGIQGDKKALTAEMILSHQTGLHNEGRNGILEFKFNPGSGFGYSGEAFRYLQKFIETKFEKDLDTLAKAKIFEPLGMNRSTFLSPDAKHNLAKTHGEGMRPHPKSGANNNDAAGSLHTTATDYARFLKACISDENFLKLISTPQIHSMEKDIDAKNINTKTLKNIDWGLGFGLQKDEKGKVVALFQWGHGPGARAFFAINAKDPKSAVVSLTNSDNGLSSDLIEKIATPVVGDISPIIKFLSEKYGYQKTDSPGWKEYQEKLIAAVVAERKGDIDLAVASYKEAVIIRPENKELEYHIMRVDTQRAQTDAPNLNEIKKLSGQFGELKISYIENKLQIDVGTPGEAPRNLQRLNDHTFLDGGVILQFARDKSGNPTSLKCYYPNGGTDRFPLLNSTSSLVKGLNIPINSLKPIKNVESKMQVKIPQEQESGVDVTKEQMADSTFGQSSNTARRLK